MTYKKFASKITTIDEQTIVRFQSDNDSDVELAIPHGNNDDDDEEDDDDGRNEVVIHRHRNSLDRPSTSSASSVTSKYYNL